jgi:tetratricopeptide (TPR) repeat protein
MRKPAIVFGIILVAVASTWLWLEVRAGDNPQLERTMCRYLICADDLLLEHAGQQLKLGTSESIRQAVDNYRESLRRDPASPYRWCDLGDALFASGEEAEARSCFARAVDRGPDLAQVLWRAGQFYLKLKENRTGLRCMARILEKSQEFDSFIFEVYAATPVADVLAYGLPPVALPAQAYLRSLLRNPDAMGTEQVWNWIVARSFADDKLAADYTNSLIYHQDYENALNAWAAYLGLRKGPYLQSNSLFNGSFELEPTGSGFDWKVREVEGVSAARDSNVRHSGRWSLRLSFEGEQNPEYRGVAQLAVLRPGNYRFEAYMRSSGITTDKGVGIRIGDAKTDALLGTNDWIKAEKDFAVEQETGPVRVEVYRERSLKIDSKIKGTFWIDDAQLISR